MAWKPKAMIALANDLVMAVTVLDENSETRAAIQQVADLLISAAIAADPTLAANVTQIASEKVDEAISDRNLVEADVTTTEDDAVVGLVDSEGARLPGAQWDVYGRPSNTMMRTLMNRGMLRADELGAGVQVIKDALGARTWVSFTEDGGFDHATQTYMQNRDHWAVGIEPPFVYPGNYIVWFDPTDLSFHLLEN